MRHKSLGIQNFGLSDQEYIDSINLEKIYSLMKKNHLRCFYCHQMPAYIHTKTFDFLCAFHASEAKYTKKIDEERFSSTEVDKILKHYNEEKLNEKCKLENFQFTSKDLWPVIKRKSCKEANHSLMNSKSIFKYYQKKERNPHYSCESGACSSDDSFHSLNKTRVHHKTTQNANVRFHVNEDSLKISKKFNNREISTQSALLSCAPLPRNLPISNHPSNVGSHNPCSKWIDSPTPLCYDLDSSVSNDVRLIEKKVPTAMNNSDFLKPSNTNIQWIQKKTMGSNPFCQNGEHSQVSAQNCSLDHCQHVYSCHTKNPFDTHQCERSPSVRFNSTAAIQVSCTKDCHDATPFVMKQKNTCKTNFINTSQKLPRNTYQPHITTNVKIKEWWEV